MEAPPIQYCKTADGVSIAFWTIGEGPPLVVLGSWVGSHVQMEWESDTRRAAYERLAKRATVIRFDFRGMGLSQSDSLDLSPEAQARDLEAVADHLKLECFALYGSSAAPGQAALVYPASHPQRVSHLIFGAPLFPRGNQERIAAIRPLMNQDWELFTDIWARLALDWDEKRSPQLAARIRATHTPTTFASAWDASQFSLEPLLAAIRTPTLILYAVSSEEASEAGRILAAGIAGAHFVGIPNWPVGSTFNETVVAAVLDFINTTPAAPGAPIPAPAIDVSAVRTIVFTDIEGSTALNERLGDEGAREVLREHERLTREALRGHGGSEVKAMGDGFMAWFPSATRAVECAIALQRATAAWNAGGGNRQLEIGDRGVGARHASPLRVRIGINAGEPIAEGDDLFGASVIAAARIAAAAVGDQILASDVVRQLLAGKGFTFTDRGAHALKGFDEAARLYEVSWRA